MYILMTDDGKFVLSRISTRRMVQDSWSEADIDSMWVDLGEGFPKLSNRFETAESANDFKSKLLQIRKACIARYKQNAKTYPHLGMDFYRSMIEHFQKMTFNVVKVTFTQVD